MWRAYQKSLREPSSLLGSTPHLKPLTTLRKVLVSPKDKTAPEKQSGAIYSIKGKDSLYIGESGRKLWKKKLAEHKSK